MSAPHSPLPSDASEVSAVESARLLGVSPQTVVGWVRRGLLPGRRDDGGNVLVDRGALRLAESMRGAFPAADAPVVPDDEIDAEIAAVRHERRRRISGDGPSS